MVEQLIMFEANTLSKHDEYLTLINKKKKQHLRNHMESCKIVNRYCIKTDVTALHSQLQSANMSPSMVKRQFFYKVCLQNS